MRTLLLALLACAFIAPAAQAATVQVEVGRDDDGVAHLRYFPETAVVWAGDSVEFRAASHTPHTVTSRQGFDSTPALTQNDPAFAAWFGPGGFLMPGQSFNRTFERPGTYSYFCKIHPAMTGTITVTNGSAPSGSSSLPLPGQDANRSQAAPNMVHVAAGWGSGDTTADMFAPKHVTVAPGTLVVFTNFHTFEPHTVTAALPNPGPPGPNNQPAWDSSPNIGPPPAWWDGAQGIMATDAANKLFRHTFANPGHYTYFCKLHPGMVGTVVVLEKPSVNATRNGPPGGATPDGPSRVPGIEAPLLLLGAAGVALLARRRAA
jgi:plastocyanin